MVKGSAPNWRSHHEFRHHYQSLIDGYDRLRGAEMMKKYARRTNGSKPTKSAAEAMDADPPEPVRVCSDCQTSKTPLWRSGPDGPKSLCNACGIRHKRKVRVRLGISEDGGGSNRINSNRTAGSGGNGKLLGLSPEELKQRQKEKQKRMLLVLVQRQRQSRSRRRRVARRPAVVAEGGGGGSGREEVEAAAFLLLSLSSGMFVH